ncbi:hypothetical protein MAHJHV28_45800 [Mycobacterium avium subsp. hominissuis]
MLAAIGEAAHVAAELIPARAPHSSEIRNADVLRMVIGGARAGISSAATWAASPMAASTADRSQRLGEYQMTTEPVRG